MPRFSLTLLAISISSVLFALPAQAEESSLKDSSSELPLIDQCLIHQPDPENPNEQPIHVEADKLEAVNGEQATYRGNVVVTQGKKRIIADNVTLHQKENVVEAKGNVKFSDGTLGGTSDRATNDLNTDEVTLENTHYKLLCEPGRGQAVYISKTGKAVYEIEDGSITSCPEGDDSWRLVASSINVDQNEEQATFYNPRFEIQSVPVLYLPWLTVPIGDTRKTGFLYPTVSYGSSDGYEVEVPIYWNLHPQLDLTTTIKYMSERGTQLNGDFRYLNFLGQGNIEFEYLPDDQKYLDKGDRWGVQYRHHGIFAQSWKFDIDYSKVSDIDYFSDVDSSIGKREDGQLVQQGQASYRTDNWDTSIMVRDFQLLLDDPNNRRQPYRLMPQVAFNYYTPQVLPHVDFDVISHVSRFETDAKGAPSATRVHVEPGITVPFGNTWGTWTTEARLLGTYYQQDLSDLDRSRTQYRHLDDEVTRVIPQFRTHAGLVLERDTSFIDGYTQTLEPQLQYLYVPSQRQNNIALYDTTLMQADYYGLFRSRKFSGVDYIAPANQFSYGATTRFFDDGNKERLNISFGQIFYLDKSTKETSPYEDIDNNDRTNYSAWAVEMDFNYDDALFYHGGIQYDVDSGSVQSGNSTLEYRFDSGYVQTNYRYVDRDYIDETVTFNTNGITKDGISQLGLLGSYQINRNWAASAQYFYDLTIDQDIEWMANLKYLSDCWYIGFTYSNQLRRWDRSFNDYPNATPEYENNFSVNFGIIGFGTAMGTEKASGNALGYGRPFFLNN